MLAAAASAFPGSLLHLRKGGRKQTRHLADCARAASIQAQRIECHADICFACDRIAERLRKNGFSRPDITCKHEKGRAVTEKVDELDFAVVMFCAPRGEALRVEQQARFLEKAFLHLVQTHERREAPRRSRVRKLANLLEYAYLVIHHEYGWKV